MLGRKNYTQEELDNAKAAVNKQIAAYKQLVKVIDGAPSDPKVASALETFEPLFFNNMIMVLDRYFVHRLRMVTGKDGNPLNEVELLTESLMNNDGVLSGNKVVKLVPEQSVTELNIGDRISLSGAQFERLAEAFFTEIERRFLWRPRLRSAPRESSPGGRRRSRDRGMPLRARPPGAGWPGAGSPAHQAIRGP